MENTQHKTGRVQWLKHEVLSSNPITTKNLRQITCIDISPKMYKRPRNTRKRYSVSLITRYIQIKITI
jgi:hypothetical protein